MFTELLYFFATELLFSINLNVLYCHLRDIVLVYIVLVVYSRILCCNFVFS